MSETKMKTLNDFIKTLSEGERLSQLAESIKYITKNLEKEKQLT